MGDARWRDDIAYRLAHLPTVLIQHKSMGHYPLVWSYVPVNNSKNTIVISSIPRSWTQKEVRREERNHPRCWSRPSRYKSAGAVIPLWCNTLYHDAPLSNHTSMVSVPFVYLACKWLRLGGRSSERGRDHQQSVPCLRTNSTTCLTVSLVINASPFS